MPITSNSSSDRRSANSQYQSLKDVGYLSNGQIVKILKSEIKAMEDLEVSKNRNNRCRYYANETYELFKRNLGYFPIFATMGIWMQFLEITYYNLKSFPRETHFSNYIENFDLNFAVAMNALMSFSFFTILCAEVGTRDCHAKEDVKDKLALTVAKIQFLISRLNHFKSNEPVESDILSSVIFEIDFPEYLLEKIANMINMDQIINLRKQLGKERFQPILRYLSRSEINFIEVVFNLDDNESIYKQVQKKYPSKFNAFLNYIGSHKNIWISMIKLKKRHFSEDLQILEKLGRGLLKNPDKARSVIQRIHIETYGTDI